MSGQKEGNGFKALRALSHRSMTQGDMEEMKKQVYAEENDRGACLLLTADLENALDNAIKARLTLDKNELDEMYGQEGPLGSFSRKIILASAIRIVGPITKHNLTIIRHVRNAFAHARIPMSFQTPEVHTACEGFKLIHAWVGEVHMLAAFEPDWTTRLRFTSVCSNISRMLLQYSMLPKSVVTGNTPVFKGQFQGFDLLFQRQPLP